jgi:hypothetical protein
VVVPVFAQPMPKTLRLRIVDWLSWEIVDPDIFRSPTMIRANDSIKPEGGVRCKTGLDWRVILVVLAACWIF